MRLHACVAVVVGTLAVLAGCEEEGCEDFAYLGDEQLVGLIPENADAVPAPTGEIRLRASLCGEEARTQAFQTLEGVPPQSAVQRGDRLFVGRGFLVTTTGHPLHRVWPDSMGDPRPVRRCRADRLRGRLGEPELIQKFFTLVLRDGSVRTVTMHPSLRADLPRVGGLPRVVRGLRVRVDGFACRSGNFYAMSIARLR